MTGSEIIFSKTSVICQERTTSRGTSSCRVRDISENNVYSRLDYKNKRLLSVKKKFPPNSLKKVSCNQHDSCVDIKIKTRNINLRSMIRSNQGDTTCEVNRRCFPRRHFCATPMLPQQSSIFLFATASCLLLCTPNCVYMSKCVSCLSDG